MKSKGFVNVEDGIDGFLKGSTLVVKKAEVCYGVSGQAAANYGLLLPCLVCCSLLLADYGWPWPTAT